LGDETIPAFGTVPCAVQADKDWLGHGSGTGRKTRKSEQGGGGQRFKSYEARLTMAGTGRVSRSFLLFPSKHRWTPLEGVVLQLKGLHREAAAGLSNASRGVCPELDNPIGHLLLYLTTTDRGHKFVFVNYKRLCAYEVL
jgi:hypothetical protein